VGKAMNLLAKRLDAELRRVPSGMIANNAMIGEADWLLAQPSFIAVCRDIAALPGRVPVGNWTATIQKGEGL